MAIRFVVQARAIVRQAEKEAAEDGSPLIGAEHMLLAMTGEHGIEARDVLASAGLDRDALRAALDREFRQSLAAAGVTLPPGGLPAASRDPARRARMAASGKLVLERALKAAAGRGQIRPGHLLLGVLAAQAGAVPRALALAGVDQGGLAARTRRALEQGQP
ncbi:MAG TPA: Clp protease N-terminal domain-containing protein [Streptosporangiaceae bacterium]|nr:Clp protease N-terminal domain-containing protein [Streptosporangiaceae bacterium]